VLDNAAIHQHDVARIALDGVFESYDFNARYSPHLSPIETCFAMVKNLFRERELEAQIDVITCINECFGQFEAGRGQQAHKVWNHFKIYFANHDDYKLEMATL